MWMWWCVGPSSSAPALRSRLDEWERARADALVHAADRDRYVSAHALLRRLIELQVESVYGYVGLGVYCPDCGRDDHGRPVLTTDSTVQLSLSRSGDRVVAAFARGRSTIGVDVEPESASGFPGFDAVALTANEAATIARLPAVQRDRERTRLWVAKEAALKRSGRGLQQAPAEFDLAECADVITGIDVGFGYVCALATAEPVDVEVIDGGMYSVTSLPTAREVQS